MSIKHKPRPDADEKERILNAWASGEMTLQALAKRFDRSRKVITEIVRNSGALKNEQGFPNCGLATDTPDAPDMRPIL